jgi:hypothetical protein
MSYHTNRHECIGLREWCVKEERTESTQWKKENGEAERLSG